MLVNKTNHVDQYQSCSPLAVLSLQVYVPLSSSCTELSSSMHLFPSKYILQFSRAGWMSFPSDSQSTSVSCGPITWHSNKAVSPAFTITSLTGRMMARPGSIGRAGVKMIRINPRVVKKNTPYKEIPNLSLKHTRVFLMCLICCRYRRHCLLIACVWQQSRYIRRMC